MAKDPAFLFYPNDFDASTKFFSNEQVGIYLRLLIAQFQHGRLSEKQVLFICKTYDVEIMSKFKKDESGLTYNERLESEIHKRKNYSKSRSDNRKKTSHEKHMKNISSNYVKHMENENENENENKIEDTLWTNIKMKFENDFRFEEHFCRIKNISLIRFKELRTEFVNEIELRQDYKELKELKNHFTNWFNKNNKNGKSILSANSQKRQDAMQEYLNRYTDTSGEGKVTFDIFGNRIEPNDGQDLLHDRTQGTELSD